MSYDPSEPEPLFPPDLIITSRLRLRRPRMGDARTIFERYASDQEVSRYMLWAPHDDLEETRLFLASCVHAWAAGVGERSWIIETLDDGLASGMLGCTVEGHMVEIGYVLARALWGQGLMTEALSAVAQAAFEDPAIHRLSATVAPENPASARVLEKAGFTREGTMRRYHIFPSLGDTPRDTWLYARVRE